MYIHIYVSVSYIYMSWELVVLLILWQTAVHYGCVLLLLFLFLSQALYVCMVSLGTPNIIMCSWRMDGLSARLSPSRVLKYTERSAPPLLLFGRPTPLVSHIGCCRPAVSVRTRPRTVTHRFTTTQPTSSLLSLQEFWNFERRRRKPITSQQ